MDIRQTINDFQRSEELIRQAIARRIIGLQQITGDILACLLSGGHVLLEGVPGIGKTMLVKTLAETLDLSFSRIQFTPDLMPADIIGTNVVIEDQQGNKQFRFQQGPIFGHIILADEINRATPKTQSAVLEAMAERSVTVARNIHRLEQPFMVLATQNPLEMEGTYPLPEAQLDRFMFKLLVSTPSLDELSAILRRTTGPDEQAVEPVVNRRRLLDMQQLVRMVETSADVAEYVSSIVLATHPDNDLASPTVRRHVRYGASPRAAQAILLAAKVSALRDGRGNVAYQDARQAAPAALRHRLILTFEAEAEGIRADEIIADVLTHVPHR